MREKKTNLAVSVLIINNGKFLLLKRTAAPYTWEPPGGRVRLKETLLAAAKREAAEETGLVIDHLVPISTWSGVHDRRLLYAICFVARSKKGAVKLSPEHSDLAWASLKDLRKYHVSHAIQDFQQAISLPKVLKTRKRREK